MYMIKENTQTNILIFITFDMKQKLRHLAVDKNLSMSELIRQAIIKTYFEENSNGTNIITKK